MMTFFQHGGHGMKPSELFDVVIRSIGLLITLSAMSFLFYAILNLALGGPISVVGLLIIGIPSLLVGIWLLRGASHLAASLYAEDSTKDR
jgi:hypothetical protein